MSGMDTRSRQQANAERGGAPGGTATGLGQRAGGASGGRWSANTTAGPAARVIAVDDSLGVVRPLLTATRWGTLAVGLAVAASGDRSPRWLAWGVALAVYALIRTFWPLSSRNKAGGLIGVLGEVSLTMLVVVATGYWSSPYLFCLASAVVAAGFARGFRFAATAAMAASLAVAIPFHLRSADADLQRTVLGTCEVLLIACVTGYARRMFGEAEARTSLALDRLTRLTEANGLLQELHHVAQTLPATLDLHETVRETASRARQLLAPDAVAILLYEATLSAWVVATSEGVRLTGPLLDRDLPQSLSAAARSGGSALVRDLGPGRERGPGLSPTAASAIYVPLRSRAGLIGLLAGESDHARQWSDHDTGLAEGLAEQAALAIDNARWFAKLRTVGADEERTRIARDLHDRVGQSLAYLAFELDRITGKAAGEAIEEDLSRLRHDVRAVVSEVRETLYDLRTNVTETHDLVATIDAFLQRVRERTNATVVFRSAADRRLPLPQERELWRVAQEAVTNAERHAAASSITVIWRCDAAGAQLEVADDGAGFRPATDGRRDSYGIVGMRERADAIGASFDLTTEPGVGTRIRCALAAPEGDQ